MTIFFGILLFFAVSVLTTGEAALTVILGVVGTYLTQFLKKYAGGGGNKALILTILVCTGLAFLATIWSGTWDASNVIQSSLNVFTLATLAYRLLLSKDSMVKQESSPPSV